MKKSADINPSSLSPLISNSNPQNFQRKKPKMEPQKNAMDAFEKLQKVGEGSYGKVYKAREKAIGKIVALKKTKLHEDEEGVPRPTTLREISILRMLSRDPHVVKYVLFFIIFRACSINHVRSKLS